jgi:hypothetical protein
LSKFIETSLREEAAIAVLTNCSWRRLAFLPRLPFGVGESELSSTGFLVGIGVDKLGFDGGAVGSGAARDEGVAGFAIGRG